MKWQTPISTQFSLILPWHNCSNIHQILWIEKNYESNTLSMSVEIMNNNLNWCKNLCRTCCPWCILYTSLGVTSLLCSSNEVKMLLWQVSWYLSFARENILQEKPEQIFFSYCRSRTAVCHRNVMKVGWCWNWLDLNVLAWFEQFVPIVEYV